MTLTLTEEINTVQHSVFPKQLFAYMEVEGQRVRFQLDLGASCNVIRRQDLVPTVVLEKTNQTLCFYNRSQLRPLGKCLVNMNNPKTGRKYKANFVVVDNASTSLLGARSIQQMDLVRIQHENIMAATLQTRCQDNVDSTNTHMSGQNVSETPVQIPDLLQAYKDVFDGSLGCLGEPLHLDIEKSVTPVQIPTRKVPIALRQHLEAELKRLASLGVLEPVEGPTDWISSLVVVRKPN